MPIFICRILTEICESFQFAQHVTTVHRSVTNRACYSRVALSMCARKAREKPVNFEWALLIITSRVRSPTGIRIHQPFVPVRVTPITSKRKRKNVRPRYNNISDDIPSPMVNILSVFTEPFHPSLVDKEHCEIYTDSNG